MKKTYGLSSSVILAAGLLCLLFFLASGGPNRKTQSRPVVLRIGSTDRVKSPNFLFDYNLGLFSHLSNPPLMKMSKEGEFIGQLIEEIIPSPDKKSWAFILKEDLFWSDGRKVTAEDVRFTLRYIGQELPAAGWLKVGVRRISTAGENSVRIELHNPYSRMGVEFATHKLLPKHIWQDIDHPLRYTPSGAQVGCGPFIIADVDTNRGVVIFQKNPYWKGPSPKIDGIEIHFFQNKDVLSFALEKGDIDIFYDYASSYPYSSLAKLKSNPRFGFIENMNMALCFLGFNLRKPPMDDFLFREAISCAVNYQEIIKIDLMGYGQVPNRGFVPPSMEFFKDTPPLLFDPSRAKEILEKAGYKDGNENGVVEDGQGNDIELIILISPDYARLAELVGDYLRNIGLKTRLKIVDRSTWVNLKDRYRYDLVVTRSSPWGMLMHAGWATGYFDSRRTGEGVLHVLDDPAFLELCDRTLSSSDRSAEKNSAHEIQDYYASNLPAIPLYWNVIVTPFNREFEGWIIDPLYGIYNIDSFMNIERRSR